MKKRSNVQRMVGIVAVCVILAVLFSAEPKEKPVNIYILSEKEILGQEVEWELVQEFLPVLKYLFQVQNGNNIYEQYVAGWFPIYRHIENQEIMAKTRENIGDMEIGEELARGLLEENVKGKFSNQESGTGASGIETEGELDTPNENVVQNGEKSTVSGNTMAEAEQMELSETPENIDVSKIFLMHSEFLAPTQKQKEYDWDAYFDMKEVRKEFFAIDATTEISDERIKPQTLLEKDMTLSKEHSGPQILIYHTHSQEAFADSIPGNSDTSIVGAGEYLATLLRETYGYEVLHHTGEYDVETRDYAYSNALPDIETILKENPTIEVVIDLHRDAVAEDKKLVSVQNGKTAAQVMFFNGLSYTQKQGEISYLENPYIDDNLAFSFQMQVLCNEYYPGLTRRIYLKGYRYNMHLCPKSLLIELGAQTNTCEEVKNSLDMVAHVLDMCLDEK